MSRGFLSLSQIEKSSFPLETIAWLLSDPCLKNEAYAVCREPVPQSAWLMSDLCLKEAYAVCRALVSSLGSRRIFAGASSFACLAWDVCLKN